MKRALIVGLMAAVVTALLCSCVSASIGVKGGYFMPNEDGDVGGGQKWPESGITYGAEITTALPGGIIELGLGAQYFTSDVTAGATDFSWQLIPVQGTAYFDLGRIYLGGGVGYYFLNVELDGVPESDSAMGYHGVLGFDITDMIFLEGRYATCMIDDTDVGGISGLLGIRF